MWLIAAFLFGGFFYWVCRQFDPKLEESKLPHEEWLKEENERRFRNGERLID